jgi:phosphocarrier protein
MVSQKTKIINEQGMHMRPASVLSQALAPFESSIKILFNGNEYDAKSVMMLMAACLKCGSELEVVCDGPDEADALKKAIELIDSGMGD